MIRAPHTEPPSREGAHMLRATTAFAVVLVLATISYGQNAPSDSATPVSSSIQGDAAAAGKGNAIRPFQFTATDESLSDLRKRIAATRWPDKETVSDATQGVQLA